MELAAGQYFDGYLSDVNFVDGLALTPTSFGEFKNGVWIPIDTSGLTFGTNGFRLQFDQVGVGTASTSTIGADTSGNTNHFTSSGIVASDCAMPDSPENNFAVINPLAKSTYASMSEGNLKIVWSDNASAQLAANPSTITLPNSGKWYFELSNAQADGNNGIGIGICDATQIASGGNVTPTNYYLYRSDANNTLNGYLSDTGSTGSLTTFLSSHSNVVGIAVDLDDGKFWAAVNNTWQGSGSPNPATGTDAGFSSISNSVTWVPFVAGWEWTGSVTTATVNFGQDASFAGAITAGTETDGNGYGLFKYAPPLGFLALCTANLPEPTIGANSNTQADDHFNTVLYTGNGHTRSYYWLRVSTRLLGLKQGVQLLSIHLLTSTRGTY
jgi:hypothetical protein